MRHLYYTLLLNEDCHHRINDELPHDVFFTGNTVVAKFSNKICRARADAEDLSQFDPNYGLHLCLLKHAVPNYYKLRDFIRYDSDGNRRPEYSTKELKQLTRLACESIFGKKALNSLEIRDLNPVPKDIDPRQMTLPFYLLD